MRIPPVTQGYTSSYESSKIVAVYICTPLGRSSSTAPTLYQPSRGRGTFHPCLSLLQLIPTFSLDFLPLGGKIRSESSTPLNLPANYILRTTNYSAHPPYTIHPGRNIGTLQSSLKIALAVLGGFLVLSTSERSRLPRSPANSTLYRNFLDSYIT